MKKKKPSEINKLDWNDFNFLENLLVFCIMSERDAPIETNLRFRISPRETDSSLCLLFETDRRGDSLFQDGEKQPDYMALYINAEQCICTIIEMKGGKDITGGIKQVRNLYNRLKEEIKNNLPSKLEVKFQALVLHSRLKQTSDEIFFKQSTDKFVIRPLPCFDKIELFDFVSQKFTFTTPNNKPQNIRKMRKDSFIEETITNSAYQKRKLDKFSKKNINIVNNHDGIFINHELSKKNYSALAVDNSKMRIGFKKLMEDSTKKIKKDLKNIGLNQPEHYKTEQIK